MCALSVVRNEETKTKRIKAKKKLNNTKTKSSSYIIVMIAFTFFNDDDVEPQKLAGFLVIAHTYTYAHSLAQARMKLLATNNF